MTFEKYGREQNKNNLAVELEAQKQYIKDSLDELEPGQVEIHYDLARKQKKQNEGFE